MPSVGPELAVRLSAQGVQDVVNAFARVRQEGKKTGSETASALSGITASLQGLVAAAGVGVAVQKLGGLVLAARESAEDIGKLSEKTGGSVGTLSALALSAHDSEVSLEDMSKGMIKLAKAQDQATHGGKDQIAAFKQLGIGITDLNQLNAADLFGKVAQKLGQMPAGSARAALSLKLFGKAGAELIPMLDSLGQDGLAPVIAKAKTLGLYLDDDVVNSARAAQDALHELEDVAAGLATQFNAGFMPGFTAGVKTLAQEVTGEGVSAMQTFGDKVGDVVAHYIAGFTIIAEWSKHTFSLIADGVKGMAGVISSFDNAYNANGHSYSAGYKAAKDYWDGHKDALAKSAADEVGIIKATRSRVLSELNQNLGDSRQRKPTSYPKGRGSDGDGTSEEGRAKATAERQKIDKAHSEMLQARADNEIAILRATNQIEEADDKRKYDAGLMSLEDYYSRRATRIDAAFDAEYAQLQAKEAAALDLPGGTPELNDKRSQEVAKIRAAEYQLVMKRQGDLAANEDELAKARVDNAQRDLQNQQKLAQMTGDRATAARLALQQEINEYTLLLQKQGKSADEIERAVEDYRGRATAKIDFGEAQQSGSSAMNALNQAVQGVQGRQGAGALSQIAATAQIIDLQRQQLPLLKQIGDQMLVNAIAAGDTQMVDEALAYNAQLEQMELGLKNVKSAATEFTDQLSSQGYGAVVDFFSDGISGAKSFGDAMGDLAGTFEKMVGRMIAQLLVYYALSALVGWIAPNSSLATSLKASGPFGKGFAEGGWTGGTAGQFAGVVHGEEFVVKAGPAAQHRDMLEAMNAGLSPARIATAADYATPMPSAPEGNTTVQVAAPIVQVINNSGQPARQQQGRGPNGEDMIQVIIGEVDKRIANNGSTGKMISKRFGLTPQGRTV